MRKRVLTVLVAALAAVLVVAMVVDGDPGGILSGRFEASTQTLKSYEIQALTPQQAGAVYFTFGDFSALSSEALEVSASPWKLATALLALRATGGDLEAVTPEKVTEIFRRYGFVVPDSIANWPEGVPPPTFGSIPLGQNVAFAGRLLPPIGLTVSNISCAGCHASVVYDSRGKPDTTTVWLGTPNGSINLERYVTELYAALRDRPADENLIWAAMQKLYPDTEWREWLTLRFVVLPKVAAIIAEREATIGKLLPFAVSTAGATNGLQALQARLGVIPSDQPVQYSVPISVPELGGRIWRSSLLAGGSYAVPGQPAQRVIHKGDVTPEHLRALGGVTAFFTVPSMGTTPDVAATHVDDADRIMQWMEDYQPQPFPTGINGDLADRGNAIYDAACASCHGTYEGGPAELELVEFPNWQGDVGTDRTYLELFDQATVDAVNGLGYGALLDGNVAPNYVAQPLTGLWSSAPYLHNGSVPTLWHLMHPAERPKLFEIGGHALDLEKVGIAGVLTAEGSWIMPPGYVPWTEPVTVDTTIPGLMAIGHEAPFDSMSEDDKTALLEFLKRL